MKSIPENTLEGDEAMKLTDPSKFYFAKYKEPIFMNNMQGEIDKFLTSFLEGSHKPFLNTEKMIQKSKVRKICSDNFQSEVLKNPAFQECIIEVYKHDCPSCNYNGKVFNVFSRKLERYGLLDKLPCF